MQSRVAAACVLVLPGRVRDELVRLVQQGYPSEVCGLLEGRRAGNRIEAVRAVAARNLERNRSRDRFELAPADWFAAAAAAHTAGRALIGVWHSHPDAAAVPSPGDLAAAWPEYSYLIASVARTGVGELRSWRLCDGRFCEQLIECPVEHPVEGEGRA